MRNAIRASINALSPTSASIVVPAESAERGRKNEASLTLVRFYWGWHVRAVPSLVTGSGRVYGLPRGTCRDTRIDYVITLTPFHALILFGDCG